MNITHIGKSNAAARPTREKNNRKELVQIPQKLFTAKPTRIL